MGVGLSLQVIYMLPDCSSHALPRHRPALESLCFSSSQTIFLSKVSHFTPSLISPIRASPMCQERESPLEPPFCTPLPLHLASQFFSPARRSH